MKKRTALEVIDEVVFLFFVPLSWIERGIRFALKKMGRGK